MSFSVNIPVKIISGNECIKNNRNLFMLGKKAFIVTGRTSAKLSGALDDITYVLGENKIGYEIFSEIIENPPIETCFKAGRLCAVSDCDFVIGIGGGSALDAAKAIAAYAVDDFATDTDIFDAQNKKHASLLIIAVPTTAGTGSEANNYSILTLPDGSRKKTFTHADSWARYAFLDPKYTYTLPREYTFSTALDAFHHALESYMSPKSNDFSEILAVYAARNIWNVLSELPDIFTSEMHETLLYASCAAGLAISMTVTGFPHPLGYSLTLLDGIPHGKACAAFAGDYIEYNMKCVQGKERLLRFCSLIGTKEHALAALLTGIADVELSLDEDEIKKHIELIKNAKNYANSPYVISETEMYDIYRSHFGKSESSK